MPIETATYLPDLNAANPAHTDGLNQADSHMRLIKAVLKNTFPDFTNTALIASQAQIDAAVNSVVIGATPARVAPGTYAAPGITQYGFGDTGIVFPAPGYVAISNQGVITTLFDPSHTQTVYANFTGIGNVAGGSFSGGTGQLVPVGSSLLWWDDALPAEGGYVWANGQAISRASYPVLFARWSTRYGAGDGSTTFGVPDLRDAVPVGKSTMGGAASRGLQTLTNTVLNTLIGAANVVLGIGNLPTITSSVTQSITVQSVNKLFTSPSGTTNDFNPTTASGFRTATNDSSFGLQNSSGSNTITVTSAGTTATAVNNVQPSTTCNYIIRAA